MQLRPLTCKHTHACTHGLVRSSCMLNLNACKKKQQKKPLNQSNFLPGERAGVQLRLAVNLDVCICACVCICKIKSAKLRGKSTSAISQQSHTWWSSGVRSSAEQAGLISSCDLAKSWKSTTHTHGRLHTHTNLSTSVIFLPRLWLIEERSMQVQYVSLPGPKI